MMTARIAPSISARQEALTHNLALELNLPQARLHGFVRLQDDLFLDTQDVELLIAKLESRLEYFLTEEEIAGIETLGDLQRVFLR